MVSVHDVAAYILERHGPMSAMKLQKLVYYAQAWHLVWEEDPLLAEPVEAWANGPVVYDLFQAHRGRFTVSPPWQRGDSGRLSSSQRGVVDAVLADYGALSGRKLSFLTHSEDPWRIARGSLPSTAVSRNVIFQESIHDYYDAVENDASATPVDELEWPGWDAFESAGG
jgi:uncharacterized phage-associated protein